MNPIDSRLPIGEQYNDINEIVMQYANNEEVAMSQIQDEIKKLEEDVTQERCEGVELKLSFIQAILAGLRSVIGESYQKDVLSLTARCISLSIQLLFQDNKAKEVLSYLDDDINQYILSEIELYGSNNINILKSLSKIYITCVKARIQLNESVTRSEELKSCKKILRLFCASAENESYKLAASLYMSELADLLALNGYKKEAIDLYRELFEIFPIESFNDRRTRNAATLAFGHYVQCAILEDSINNDDKETLCLRELELFKTIQEEENTAKSLFDFAIACAHASDFYFNIEDISSSATLCLAKFKLLSSAIRKNFDGREDEDATNERLSQSFINSCQNIINCALLSDLDDKIKYMTTTLSYISDILECYEDDIRLYSYANAFTDELFKEYEKMDEYDTAQYYLLYKVHTVLHLLNKFPGDEALLEELRNTIKMGDKFVKCNYKRINDELRYIWEKLN